MNNNIEVNVYCVTYNHSKYIRQALDGILMQKTTFTWNIVLYDDASTDDNQNIIREYIDKYPDKFDAILSNENLYSQGESSFPLIVPHCTGKYIATCEGDDYWTDPYKLQKQYDFLENNPQYVACYHNVAIVDKNGTDISEKDNPYPHFDNYVYESTMLPKLPGQTASKFMRNIYKSMSKECVEQCVRYKINGDMRDVLLLTQQGNIYCMKDIMAAHRVVRDEGDSWKARVERGDINIHEYKYRSYGEMEKLSTEFCSHTFNGKLHQGHALLGMLRAFLRTGQKKCIKSFFICFFLHDYCFAKKIGIMLELVVSHMVKKIMYPQK